jgi:hypothetical protein
VENGGLASSPELVKKWILGDDETMSCGSGTSSQWWLSWDWEYRGWNAAGLEVDACIQFTSSMFPQSMFDNPFQAGEQTTSTQEKNVFSIEDPGLQSN